MWYVNAARPGERGLISTASTVTGDWDRHFGKQKLNDRGVFVPLSRIYVG